MLRTALRAVCCDFWSALWGTCSSSSFEYDDPVTSGGCLQWI